MNMLKFIPFASPPSDHHPLATGLSTENGVTAKGLVDGINTYFEKVFDTIKGDAGEFVHTVEQVDSEARTKISSLEAEIEALHDSHASMSAQMKQVISMLQAVITGPAPAPKPLGDPAPSDLTLGQPKAAQPAPDPVAAKAAAAAADAANATDTDNANSLAMMLAQTGKTSA